MNKKQCSSPRNKWKYLHRMRRIAAREALKVYQDTIIYGTGAWKVNDAGEPEHIPALEIFPEDMQLLVKTQSKVFVDK